VAKQWCVRFSVGHRHTAPFALVLLALGCGAGVEAQNLTADASGATDGVTPSTVSVEPRPTFTAAPDIIADYLPCPFGAVTSDAAAFEQAQVVPAELAALVTGEHPTSLRWSTLAPLPASEGAEEPATLQIEFAGTARLYASCGNYTELDVRLSLRSRSGALELSGPGVVTAWEPAQDARRALFLRARFPATTLPNWRSAFGSVSNAALDYFSLGMDFTTDPPSGTFSADQAPFGSCSLAHFPADAPCNPGERPVPGSESFHGLRLEYALDALGPLQLPQNFSWEDTHAGTQATFDFQPLSDVACVPQNDPDKDGNFSYAVPGTIHFSTSDGRADITMPARLGTTNYGSDWGPLNVSTNGWSLLQPDDIGAFNFPALAGRRPIVEFDSKHPFTVADGAVYYLGGLDIQAIDLVSPSVQPDSPACVVTLLGPVTPLTSGDYGTAAAP
jgi:hypothetical protein